MRYSFIIIIIWGLVMAQLFELKCDGDTEQIAFDGYIFGSPYDKVNGTTSWRCTAQCGLYVNTTCNDGQLQFHSFGRNKSKHDLTKHHSKINEQQIAYRGFRDALSINIRSNKGISTANEYFEQTRRERPYFIKQIKGFDTWKVHIYKIKNEFGTPKTPFDPTEIYFAMEDFPEYA
eukprot:129491_1